MDSLDIRFHDLLRTFAATALQNGMDIKPVSSMPGLYITGFTLPTYTPMPPHKNKPSSGHDGAFMEWIL